MNVSGLRVLRIQWWGCHREVRRSVVLYATRRNYKHRRRGLWGVNDLGLHRARWVLRRPRNERLRMLVRTQSTSGAIRPGQAGCMRDDCGT